MTAEQKIKMLMIQGGGSGKVRELARVLDISEPSALNKLKGRQDFKLKEIRTFAETYGLSDEQIVKTFIRR